MKLSFAFVAALLACEGSQPPPPAPPTPPPTPPAPALAPKPLVAPAALQPPTCMPPDPGLWEHTRTGDALAMCYLETEDVLGCWSFDLASATWTPRERRRRDRSSLTPRQVTVVPGTITVCKPDLSDCQAIAITFPVQKNTVIEADTNADRSLVSVVSFEGDNAIFVVDRIGAIVTTIKPWPTPMSGDPTEPSSFDYAYFAGPSLAAYISDTPVTSAIRLFDPKTGKKIGDVGKGMAIDLRPVEVGPKQFAFVTLAPTSIVVVDVTTGKRIRRYAVTDEIADIGALALAPGGKALFFFHDAGTAYRIDLASGKVTRLVAPACK